MCTYFHDRKFLSSGLAVGPIWVRRRIAYSVKLDAEIEREEPNAIVRLLYDETIEKDVGYLHTDPIFSHTKLVYNRQKSGIIYAEQVSGRKVS